MIMFDVDLSGSNLYGVVRALRGDCTNTKVGDECNWAEAGAVKSAGNAVHLVRDYSLQAVFTLSKCSSVVQNTTVTDTSALVEIQLMICI